MHSTERAKNVLVPLILRLTLAGIFIYHGLGKIVGRENAGGAGWAEIQWERQSHAPAGLEEKFDQVAQAESRHPERILILREKVKAQYGANAPPLPGSLRAAVAQLAVAWGELVGGIALLLGIFTRFAALALIVIQLGAIATVTWAHGFTFAQGGGYEYNVALVATCLALAILGPGVLAVDRRRAPRRKPAVTNAEAAPAVPV